MNILLTPQTTAQPRRTVSVPWPARDPERFAVLCPYHQERTPSCTVFLRRGLFYCFGCQATGFIVLGDDGEFLAEEED